MEKLVTTWGRFVRSDRSAAVLFPSRQAGNFSASTSRKPTRGREVRQHRRLKPRAAVSVPRWWWAVSSRSVSTTRLTRRASCCSWKEVSSSRRQLGQDSDLRLLGSSTLAWSPVPKRRTWPQATPSRKRSRPWCSKPDQPVLFSKAAEPPAAQAEPAVSQEVMLSRLACCLQRRC